MCTYCVFWEPNQRADEDLYRGTVHPCRHFKLIGRKFGPQANSTCSFFIPDIEAKELGKRVRKEGYSIPIR
jgi:hypothetical protein